MATLALSASSQNNAIDAAMVWELRDAIERVAADDRVRAMILTANSTGGGLFSPGFASGTAAVVLSDTPQRQPPQLLAALRVPTVAALFGDVGGAALELALACDVRVAAADAVFRFPQLSAGGFPCWGGTQRLTRLVGIGRALEIVLLGEPLSATDALAASLVTRLALLPEVLSEAQRLAEAWVRGAPAALAYLKEAVQLGGDLALDRGLRLEWDLAVLLETTADRAEGIQAFREKRPPQFKGQ